MGISLGRFGRPVLREGLLQLATASPTVDAPFSFTLKPGSVAISFGHVALSREAEAERVSWLDQSLENTGDHCTRGPGWQAVHNETPALRLHGIRSGSRRAVERWAHAVFTTAQTFRLRFVRMPRDGH